ncbi:MAG: hypothetical protein VKJ09_10760, partial [Leptolyngbya sp.]|nr:hypothetical protein [Leptolyngbya sp.]
MKPPLLTDILLSALRRHGGVGAIAAVATALGVAACSWLLLPTRYESSVRLMVEENSVSVSDLGQALAELGGDGASGVNPLATQSELITSREVIGAALERLSTTPQGQSLPSVSAVQGELSVRVLPATNILEIRYGHEDPAFATQLLGEIAQSSIAANTATIRLEASSVRSFLETRIPLEEAALERAAAAERRFREQSGIVALETQTQNLMDSLSQLEADALTLQAELENSREQQRLLAQVTGMTSLAQAYGALQVGQSERLQDLAQRLTAVEAAIAAARSRLGDQHPDLLALYDERTDLQALYTQQLQQLGGSPDTTSDTTSAASQDLITQYILGQIQQSALEQRLTVVQQEGSRLRQVVTTLPQQQQTLAALERRRADAEAALQRLQDQVQEARIAEAQLVSNLRLIGAPIQPDQPVSPDGAAIGLLGAVAGLLVGGGAIALLEILDDRLHDEAAIEQWLQLPVLGTLPPLPSTLASPHRLEAFLDDAARVEPYRRLLNVLGQQCRQRRLDGSGQGCGVVITSVQPEAGKSATAIYLAAVAAMLSRRSLVVDADLWQAAPTQFFGAGERPGFAQVVRQTLPEATAILATGLANLGLMPCGQAPSRPAILAELPATETLLERLKADHDWVFLDTTVLSHSADALALSRYAEGMVLVVRPGYTRRRDLAPAIAELRRHGTPVLGVICNHTPLVEETDPATPAA